MYLVCFMMAASTNYLLELSKRKDFLYQQILEYDKEKYAILAHQDALTGLKNRLGFMYEMQQLLSHTDPNITYSGQGFLVFIDLNGFRPINDQYGHRLGDEVLKIIAQRLQTMADYMQSIVARLGGDEFIMFIDTVSSRADIDRWLEILAESIAKTMIVDINLINKELSVTASIGHSIIRGNSRSLEQAIEQADKRMYANKRSLQKEAVLNSS